LENTEVLTGENQLLRKFPKLVDDETFQRSSARSSAQLAPMGLTLGDPAETQHEAQDTGGKGAAKDLQRKSEGSSSQEIKVAFLIQKYYFLLKN